MTSPAAIWFCANSRVAICIKGKSFPTSPAGQGRAACKAGAWTEEAMEKAIPYPSPEISAKELKLLVEKFKPEQNIEEIPGAEAEILGAPSRANVNTSPYDKGGKLFFTLKGRNYSCSAQFVGNTNVLMTAAYIVIN